MIQKGCRCRMHQQTDFQNRCQIKQFVTDNLGLIISCYQVNKSCRKIKAQFVVFCSHISITILAKAPIPPGDGLYQLLFEGNNVSVITAHHSPPSLPTNWIQRTRDTSKVMGKSIGFWKQHISTWKRPLKLLPATQNLTEVWPYTHTVRKKIVLNTVKRF